MSDEAGTLHDYIVKLFKAIQMLDKEVTLEEKKHPFAKAGRAIKTYSEGMKSNVEAFAKAKSKTDGYYAVYHSFGSSINANALPKLMSFRDTDCKEIDQIMNSLKKAHNDYISKKKKEDKDEQAKVNADAAGESLKKISEDARNILKKFNNNAYSLMNILTEEMKKSYEKVNEDGAKI